MGGRVFEGEKEPPSQPGPFSLKNADAQGGGAEQRREAPRVNFGPGPDLSFLEQHPESSGSLKALRKGQE